MSVQESKKTEGSRQAFLLHLLLMSLWGVQLLYSDAYYVNYVLLLITGICFYINTQSEEGICGKSREKRADTIIKIFAAFFTCMVAFANYRIWYYPEMPEEFGLAFHWLYVTISVFIFFFGGYYAFYNIFCFISTHLEKLIWKQDNPGRLTPQKAFVVCFVLITLTRWIVLYFCEYPGILTKDSISQMSQLMSGSYSNHHPFYHTMVMKCFVNLGLILFHEINAAVATYSFFQILITAMSFSFAVSTMSWMKVPKKIIIASMAFFVFMPYHIIYAVTIWKDIIFGCFVLLFVIFIYRCLYDLGNKNLNYGMLATASMIICLFRSNGLFVFVIITLAFVLFWKFKYKRILVILVSAVVLSFIMKHSVLEWFEVAQPDLIESLSIPAQQIARVVAERCILTDWETEMLSKIIDIDQIPSAYLDYISDPIKQLVREKGNQQLLADNAKDYMKLYLSLGLKHPTVYLRAWIDETRGYWNAGYEYWRWGVGVSDNNLGIVRTIRSIVLARCFEEYLWLFTDVQGLRLFLSIGLFIWIDIVLLMVALLRKDKVGAFVSLPIIIIVVSLLVATPVFSEFRYIYAAFCALPMVMVIVLRPIELEMG